MIALFCSFATVPYPPNPFLIPFAEKKECCLEDYQKVQSELRNLNIEAVVDSLYEEIDSPWISWDQFYFRCSRGAKQTLANYKPIQSLLKIGRGGDRCIVCHVSQDKDYPYLLASIPEHLEKIGFDGYFYSSIGGYPNPTGKEIQYAGVPYAFKIFTLMEAHTLGFAKVMWLDATVLPIADLTPLFELIETSGALFFEEAQERHVHYIFPRTQKILEELTGVNILKVPSVRGLAFGMDMDHLLTKKFLSQYLEMVEIGWPFCSGYPEEFVLSALLNQETFKPFQANIVGGQLDWKELSKRYSHQFSLGPSWFVSHSPPSNDEPLAFFYLRSHK